MTRAARKVLNPMQIFQLYNWLKAQHITPHTTCKSLCEKAPIDLKFQVNPGHIVRACQHLGIVLPRTRVLREPQEMGEIRTQLHILAQHVYSIQVQLGMPIAAELERIVHPQ